MSPAAVAAGPAVAGAGAPATGATGKSGAKGGGDAFAALLEGAAAEIVPAAEGAAATAPETGDATGGVAPTAGGAGRGDANEDAGAVDTTAVIAAAMSVPVPVAAVTTVPVPAAGSGASPAAPSEAGEAAIGGVTAADGAAHAASGAPAVQHAPNGMQAATAPVAAAQGAEQPTTTPESTGNVSTTSVPPSAQAAADEPAQSVTVPQPASKPSRKEQTPTTPLDGHSAETDARGAAEPLPSPSRPTRVSAPNGPAARQAGEQALMPSAASNGEAAPTAPRTEPLPASAPAVAAPAQATPAVAPQPPAATAPVAPAPAPAPAAHTATPTLDTQLARPVFTLATAGRGEHVMTVHVTPDTLGPVTVRAHVGTEGVRVELFAPTDAGRDALRAILPDLRRDFSGSGLSGSLDLSSQNQPAPQQDAQERRAYAFGGAEQQGESPRGLEQRAAAASLTSVPGAAGQSIDLIV